MRSQFLTNVAGIFQDLEIRSAFIIVSTFEGVKIRQGTSSKYQNSYLDLAVNSAAALRGLWQPAQNLSTQPKYQQIVSWGI